MRVLTTRAAPLAHFRDIKTAPAWNAPQREQSKVAPRRRPDQHLKPDPHRLAQRRHRRFTRKGTAEPPPLKVPVEMPPEAAEAVVVSGAVAVAAQEAVVVVPEAAAVATDRECPK
jgi:hypothetical protein